MDAIAPAVGAGHHHRADAERPRPLRHARRALRRGEGGGRAGAHLRHAGAERRDPAFAAPRACRSASATASRRAPALVELDAACKKAGIDGGLNPNINQDLWDKWIMLGSIASMCCGDARHGRRHHGVRGRRGDHGRDPRGMPQGRRGRRLSRRATRSLAARQGRPDAEGRQDRRLDPGRHGEGRRGRGQADRRRHAGARPQGRHRRAQPALRLRPSADL